MLVDLLAIAALLIIIIGGGRFLNNFVGSDGRVYRHGWYLAGSLGLIQATSIVTSNLGTAAGFASIVVGLLIIVGLRDNVSRVTRGAYPYFAVPVISSLRAVLQSYMTVNAAWLVGFGLVGLVVVGVDRATRSESAMVEWINRRLHRDNSVDHFTVTKDGGVDEQGHGVSPSKRRIGSEVLASDVDSEEVIEEKLDGDLAEYEDVDDESRDDEGGDRRDDGDRNDDGDGDDDDDTFRLGDL